MIRYIHGSANSVDIDTVYVFDSIPSFSEAKTFCDNLKGENANVICVENGIVTYCYKGTIDEINNSLLTTYKLHKQDYPLIITNKVKRDKYLKLIRATRSIISQLSRTDIRPIVKKGLNGNWEDRKRSLVTVAGKLRTIGINDNLDKNKSNRDLFKTMAFQIGQIFALFENGKELYTKDEVSSEYPLLRQYLERRPINLSDLLVMLHRLINVVLKEKCDIVGEHGVKFNGNPSVIYNIKTEQISNV